MAVMLCGEPLLASRMVAQVAVSVEVETVSAEQPLMGVPLSSNFTVPPGDPVPDVTPLMRVPSSSNFTVPPGDPVPDVTEMVAVKVTAWPVTGLGCDEVTA